MNPRRKMGTVLAEGDRIPERIVRGLGIEKDWENRYPGELSGGELQRFCIARALGERTRFLLADEISTMLDLITQSQIWNFLLEETRRRNIGMLVVSHGESLLTGVHPDGIPGEDKRRGSRDRREEIEEYGDQGTFETGPGR